MFGWLRRLKKRPDLDDNDIVLITSKCSEPGCETVGKYPTCDPFESANKPHFCMEHNKRINFCTGKE